MQLTFWITARARELATRLTTARVKTGWNQQQFAQRLRWPTAKVEQIESGAWSPSALDVTQFLIECGVPAADQPAMLELIDGDRHCIWVRPHGDLLPEAAPGVLFQHETATEIIHYDPVAIPVMLQNGSYATTDLTTHLSTDDGIVRHSRVRSAYYDILRHRDHPPATTCYLHESVLRAVPLDEEDRWDLYHDLCVTIESDAAQVRIIPANREPGLRIPGFSLLRFDAQAPVVCRASETVTLILEGDHVAAYEPYVTRLDDLALSPMDSRDLIVDIGGGQEAMASPPTATVEALARDGYSWETDYITQAMLTEAAKRQDAAADAPDESEISALPAAAPEAGA